MIFLITLLQSLITYKNKLTTKYFCELKLTNNKKGTEFK